MVGLRNGFAHRLPNHATQIDDVVPSLLVLPPGTDLHDHVMVKDGSLVLQGARCVGVAVALRRRERGSEGYDRALHEEHATR